MALKPISSFDTPEKPGVPKHSSGFIFLNAMDQNKIDLQKLTQRELIILTHNKVADLESKVEKLSEAQVCGKVELAVTKTKVGVWGTFWGVIGGGIIAGLMSLLKLQQ